MTNDFPPRIGGIESFVHDLCRLLDDDVVVLTSGPDGAAAADLGRPHPVVRTGSVLLPTPAAARRAVRLLHRSGATRVLFGAAAPLGLLAPTLRRAGATRVVALTHGHEVWWARVPGSRSLLRRIGDACDHLTPSPTTPRRRSPRRCPRRPEVGCSGSRRPWTSTASSPPPLHPDPPAAWPSAASCGRRASTRW